MKRVKESENIQYPKCFVNKSLRSLEMGTSRSITQRRKRKHQHNTKQRLAFISALDHTFIGLGQHKSDWKNSKYLLSED